MVKWQDTGGSGIIVNINSDTLGDTGSIPVDNTRQIGRNVQLVGVWLHTKGSKHTFGGSVRIRGVDVGAHLFGA